MNKIKIKMPFRLESLIASIIFGLLALIYIIKDNNYELGYTLMNSSLLCYIISENIVTNQKNNEMTNQKH